MMFELIQNYLPIVTPIIVAFGVAYINTRSKIRELKFQEEIKQRDAKRDEDMENKMNAERAAIMGKLNAHDLILTDIEKKQDEMNQKLETHMYKDTEKDKFEDDLKSATEGESELRILNRDDLSPSRKSMVSKWGKLIHEFAKKYYKSSARKDKKLRRSEFLREQEQLVINEYNKFLNQETGCLKVHKGETHRFSDFIEKYSVYTSFILLITNLIRNNIDDDNYCEQLQIQVNTFCGVLITAQGEWEKLKCIAPNETAA